jgi:hypothetical protein
MESFMRGPMPMSSEEIAAARSGDLPERFREELLHPVRLTGEDIRSAREGNMPISRQGTP